MDVEEHLETLRSMAARAERRHADAVEAAVEHERLARAAANRRDRLAHALAARRRWRAAERDQAHLLVVRARLRLCEPPPPN